MGRALNGDNDSFEAGLVEKIMLTLPLMFRPARGSDAALLTDIAFAGKRVWGYPEAWLEWWRHDLVVTPHYIHSEPVQIAEFDGAVVGFVGLSTQDKVRYLEHLWLWPENIGRGFGRALFAEAARLARVEGQRELRINSDPNAEPFYLKMGAIRIGQEIYDLPGGIRRDVPRLVYSIK